MLRLPVLLTAVYLSAVYSAAQNYPPPFPRAGAKKLLENDRVKVWDVTWPKDRPTPTHEHQSDQLSVTLVGGTVRVTRLGEPATVNKSEIGSVTFTAKGTVHVEEGLSAVSQRKIMVEFKAFASPSAQAEGGASPGDGAVKVLENERAIVWDLKWKPGQSVAGDSDDLDSVAVFLEGGTIRSATDRGAARDTVRSFGEVVYSSHGRAAYRGEAVRGTPHAVIIQIK